MYVQSLAVAVDGCPGILGGGRTALSGLCDLAVGWRCQWLLTLKSVKSETPLFPDLLFDLPGPCNE